MKSSRGRPPPLLRPTCRRPQKQQQQAPSSSINNFLPQLVDFLDIVNLSTYLLAEELLTYEERENILSLKRKHLQVPELLQVIMTKGSNWYEKFRAALARASTGSDAHLGHKDLLEILPVSIETSSTENVRSAKYVGKNELAETVAAGSPSGYNIDRCVQSHPPLPPPPLVCTTSNILHCHQLWYAGRCSCVRDVPSSPSAMAREFKAQFASCCTNSSAAEYVAYREDVAQQGSMEHFHHLSSANASDIPSSPCKPDSNWPAVAVSRQCSALLTTVKEFESTMVDMSTEKSNLRRENEMLKEENEKLKQHVEMLKKSITVDRNGHSSPEEKSTRLREEEEIDEDVKSDEAAVEFFITQQALHSAEADDIQKVKMMVRQALNSFKFSYRREEHLKQFNLLIVSDLADSPKVSWSQISWCSKMTEALVGHPLPTLRQSLKNIGMYEKIFDEYSVKLSVSLANLSNLSSLNMPFQPDLVVYCVENVGSRFYQDAIMELSEKRLGSKSWEHSIVLVPGHLGNGFKQSELQMFDKVIAAAGMDHSASRNVPLFAVPERSKSIRVSRFVLNSFATEFCLSSIEKTVSPAQCALLGLNLKRLLPSSEVDYTNLPETLHHQPIPLTKLRGEIVAKRILLAKCAPPSPKRSAVGHDDTRNMQTTFVRKLCQV